MTEKQTNEQPRTPALKPEDPAGRGGDALFHARIIESLPDIIVRTDPGGVIVEVNQAGLEISGYRRAEIVGQGMLGFIAPEDRERAARNTVLMMQTKLGPQEYHLLHKDGAKTPYEVNGDVLRGRDGAPAGMVYICRSLSERVKAHQALRQAEQIYRSVIESSHDGIVFIDDAFRFVYVNDEFCRIMGYSRDEILGRDFRQFVAPESRQLVAAHYGMRQEGLEPPSRYEFMVLRKDGQRRLVETSSSVIEDADGNRRTVAQLLDVTERRRAEKALEESEERFRVLSEESPLGISLVDAQGRYLYLNPAFTKIFGYTLEDIPTGGDWFLRAYPDEGYRREVVSAWLEDHQAYPLGEARPRTYRVVCKDGGLKTVLFRPVTISRGRQLISYEDISQREKAEESLKRSLEQYRLLFEAANDAIFLTDVQGRVFECNHKTMAVFRCAREQIIGLTPDGFSPPRQPDGAHSQERARQLIEATLGGQPQFFEWLHTRFDGSAFFAEVTLNRVPSLDGPFIQAVVRDISERKKAEESLRESEERFRVLFDSISDVIYTHDLEGRILSINRAGCEVLGYAPAEIIGRGLSELLPAHLRQTLETVYLPAMIGQGQLSGLTKCVSKDGQVHYMEYSNRLVREPGRPPHVSGVGRLVTERVLAERQMRRLEEQLLHAQKMEAVGVLAGGVAHDFNNILQAISGYVQLLLMDPGLEQRPRQRLTLVDQWVHRAADLVQRLLTFSRKAEMKAQVVDLNSQIELAARLLERTIPKMIGIRLELAPGLRPINADPTQVEQVIVNLVNNARDAMPEGGELVIATQNVCLSQDQSQAMLDMPPGDYVLLAVKDTGCGMASQTLERIFEPFFTTKDVGKGTGLGLATVYGIVKGHGGHITCDSRAGQGTTFAIYLPAAPQGRPDQDRQRPRPDLPLGGEETLLLVDDEQDILATASEALRGAGYRVLTAHTGEDALEKYTGAGETVGLVVMDLSMPGMGGQRCLARLLQHDAKAKVLVATGYADQALGEAIMAAGAVGIIKKPYHFSELLGMVREALDRQPPLS